MPSLDTEQVITDVLDNIKPLTPVTVVITLKDAGEINAQFALFSEAWRFMQGHIDTILSDSPIAYTTYVSHMDDEFQVLEVNTEFFRPFDVVTIVIVNRPLDEPLYINWLIENKLFTLPSQD